VGQSGGVDGVPHHGEDGYGLQVGLEVEQSGSVQHLRTVEV
jgi:hypothetical protein